MNINKWINLAKNSSFLIGAAGSLLTLEVLINRVKAHIDNNKSDKELTKYILEKLESLEEVQKELLEKSIIVNQASPSIVSASDNLNQSLDLANSKILQTISALKRGDVVLSEAIMDEMNKIK